MSKGGVAGDEDRDGVKSRSHKTLLALVRTLTFTPSEKEGSE